MGLRKSAQPLSSTLGKTAIEVPLIEYDLNFRFVYLPSNIMIKYKDDYINFITQRGVGLNDEVASSPDSYISYLNGISRLIDSDITPEILQNENDINNIIEKIAKRRASGTIRNYRSAMRQYVAMVETKRQQAGVALDVQATPNIVSPSCSAYTSIFVGTQDEFNKFLGPFVRNLIQNKTRVYKKSLNHTCQGCCKTARELQAAHVRGTDRITMINAILDRHIDKKTGKVSCNIGDVMTMIMDSHHPITDSFKFLCEPCHKLYDAGKLQI